MNTASLLETPAQALRKRHDALLESQPKLRIRDRALQLGVSEAALVAADCAVTSVALDWKQPYELFRALGDLGEVMALTRNQWAVHERHGRYETIQIEPNGKMGVTLGPDIDLRMFLGDWRYAYAVNEAGRHSLQFFDAEGVAAHKVYRTDASNAVAWEALVARFAIDKSMPVTEAIAAPVRSDSVSDPAALRAQWLALKDVHDFHPMLRQWGITRLAALRAVGADLAQPVALDAAETMLQAVAASGLPIMCFVGNRAMVQIHTGPVQRLLRTGPWFNVLDARFNLHLDTTALTQCWVVHKPSTDGWITSLEAYEAGGELVVQFFGARKPGEPQLSDWQALAQSLCTQPLAQ